jgi:hypothetical protein
MSKRIGNTSCVNHRCMSIALDRNAAPLPFSSKGVGKLSSKRRIALLIIVVA